MRKSWQPKRNTNNVQYQMWRQLVLERDGHKCRWPGCKKKTRLQVHHIKRYADNAFHRFLESNGISLCWVHHKKVTGKEEQYEIMFYKILLGEILSDIRIEEANE